MVGPRVAVDTVWGAGTFFYKSQLKKLLWAHLHKAIGFRPRVQETGTDQPTDSSCFSAAPLTRPPLITKKIADTICQAACARRPWLMTRGGIPPDSGGCGHPACLQSNGGGGASPCPACLSRGDFQGSQTDTESAPRIWCPVEGDCPGATAGRTEGGGSL